MGYYSNANPDLVRLADVTADSVLELGCGDGTFANAYKALNPNCQYVGVELFAEAAKIARQTLDHVIQGNIEGKNTQEKLIMATPKEGFDLLIIGDVLEHLLDPWAVMKLLRARMSQTGQGQICIPNVSHWSLIIKQLQGNWRLEDHGLLDRTHLRWFTKDTCTEMFQDAGWHVEATTPRIFNQKNGMKVVEQMRSIAPALGLDEAKIMENLLPLQWVFSLSAKPKKRAAKFLGIGMKREKLDALVDIRLTHPQTALAKAGHIDANIVAGQMPKNIPQDISILQTYRMHMNEQIQWPQVETAIKKGMLMLHDVDDDPRALPNHPNSNFRSIRSSHAVLVSTPNLGKLISQWNPHTFVVPNNINELPDLSHRKKVPNKIRLFFGALNRSKDWQAQCSGILDVVKANPDRFECTVIHDKGFYEQLKDFIPTRHLPLMQYDAYQKELLRADVALLPLVRTPFNECKSDLKIIECLAHGVIPICSDLAAQNTTVPNEFLNVASEPSDWGQHLQALLDQNNLENRRTKAHQYIARNRMVSTAVARHAELLDHLRRNFDALEADRQQRIKQYFS